MIHFREARASAIKLLRDSTGEGKWVKRAVLIEDLFGKCRALLWLAESAPGNFADDFSAEMHRNLEIYWAGLWVGGGSNPADEKLYGEIWATSNEIAPSLRLSERVRSRGFWMKPPGEPAWEVDEHAPPVIAFYSFKGGVGRTTALVSFALQRVRIGDTVVVIDLDLDAPGVATLLDSNAAEEQQFGMVDYLIESPLQPKTKLSDYYRSCPDVAGPGRAFVFPAGLLDSDYLAMLARLDLEPISDINEHPLSKLLNDVRGELKPDWILLDCRAGLSEASGFALSGLANLTVLLGTTSIQSWHGLRLVIERLGAERFRLGMPQAECVVVQTMTPENPETAESAKSNFLAEAEKVFREVYYAEDPVDEDDDAFWYVRDMESEDAPHRPSVLYYSQRLAFIRDLREVADTLVEDAAYAKLGIRLASRFAREPE